MARSRRSYRSSSVRVRGRVAGRVPGRIPGRPPVRVIAAAVGAALVLLNGLLVLAPVLGLVGAAAAAGPVLDVPAAGITAVVVLGYLVAIACAAAALVTRRTAPAWTAAALAWAVSLAASLWPIIATADAAVDRTRDVLPWIADLVRSIG